MVVVVVDFVDPVTPGLTCGAGAGPPCPLIPTFGIGENLSVFVASLVVVAILVLKSIFIFILLLLLLLW